MERKDIPKAGLITTRDWLITPDGDQNRAFWCEGWLLQTDKEMDLAGIKSSDKWAAIAFAGGEILAIIPGCEVTAYFPCQKPPGHSAYIFTA